MQTPADGFKRIVEVLERLQIRYLAGGSLAGCVYGGPDLMTGIDLVADIRPEQVDAFALDLTTDFFADPEMIGERLKQERSFNLIHYGSACKFDISPLLPDEHSQMQFKRRHFANIRSLGQCALPTVEDTILNKLRWYRAGGETSERQWNDLRGILQVSGAKLDLEYLRHWAPRLNVAELLERLLGE